jgi:hypothetical protein
MNPSNRRYIPLNVEWGLKEKRVGKAEQYQCGESWKRGDVTIR